MPVTVRSGAKWAVYKNIVNPRCKACSHAVRLPTVLWYHICGTIAEVVLRFPEEEQLPVQVGVVPPE